MYELPSMCEKRWTSFGYGTRDIYHFRDITPSPGAYEFTSAFNKSGKRGKTFGLARPASLNNKPNSHCYRYPVPGPGNYNIGLEPGKNAVKYTLRPMTTNLGH